MEKEIKKTKRRKVLRCRQTESWWPELCMIPFMSLDWPVLLCQPKQRRWGGPTLPLLPPSLPRAHPTDRMNNKPNVCLRQKERGNMTWNHHNFGYNLCLQKVSLRPPFVTDASKSLSSLSGDSCTPTHWHKYRQTMIHQLRGWRIRNIWVGLISFLATVPQCWE